MSEVLVAHDRDANKVPANIRDGVEIDGVVGTYDGGTVGGKINTVYGNNFGFSIGDSSVFYSSGNEISTGATPTNAGPNTSQKATIHYNGKIVIRFSKAVFEWSYITGYIRIKKNGVMLEDLIFQTGTEYKGYDVVEGDYFEIEVVGTYWSGHPEYYISVTGAIGLCYTIESTPDIGQLASIS